VPGGLKNGILTADRKTKNAKCDFRVKIPIFRLSIPSFTLLRAIEGSFRELSDGYQWR